MAKQGLVFISYARADERYATDIVQRLQAEDVRPWQDRLRMAPGDFEDQLRGAIEDAEYFVLVMTPAALKSEWVEKEWRFARASGVCICPIEPVFDTPAEKEELSELRRKLPKWMQKANVYDTKGYWRRFLAVLEAPCQATRSPFMPADLPAHLVHRSGHVEAAVAGVLDAARGAPSGATTVLHGSGGFGKTTLALTVCHDDDVQAACDGGVLWATLGAEPKVAVELEALYAAVTGERPGFRSVDDAMIALGRKLEAKRCLIVVDDVWDADDLKPFLHGGPNCARLVTTRRFNIAVAATDAPERRIAVAEPTTEERRALLLGGLPEEPGNDARVAELARRLGGMTLLLRLANATLREQVALGETVAEALDWALAKYEDGVAAFDEDEAVARTFELSLARLGDDRARALELGIFPEDAAVPFDVAGIVWGLDETGTRDLAQRLHDLSLATVDLRARALTLHDTARRYFEKRLDAPARVHARLADTWRDARRLTRGYPLDHAPRHVAASMADPAQTVARGVQLMALLTDARYGQWLRTHGDAAALDRDVTAAIGLAARSDDPGAARLLASLVVLRRTLAAERRDPERIFEAAAAGKMAEALARLGLFDAGEPWDTLGRLLIAWTLPPERADDARDLAAVAEPRCDTPLLRRALAWVRTAPGEVPADLDPPSGAPDARYIAAILQRAGGSEGIEGLEPLDHGAFESGLDAAGYIAERDGPELVAYARLDPEANTPALEKYIELHASNPYAYYRQRSLAALLDPVLRYPDGAWVRDLTRKIATAALAGTNVDFEAYLPLAVRATAARAGDGQAGALLETLRDATLALPVGAGAPSDSWSHSQRRAAVLAELEAVVLGRRDRAEALIRRAQSLPKGFAGFRAFSALMLAEAAAIALPDDAATQDAALKSALAAAHRIQDWRFCIQATAMVNAIRARWADLAALDIAATVERFTANPLAEDFCTVHRVLDDFEYRDPANALQSLPIPREVREAETLADVAAAFRQDPSELLELNGWIWAAPAAALTEELQKNDEVKVPDRAFVPILAARFAAAALASPGLPAEARPQLIQRLVPLALPNRTALDAVLGRLLLAAPDGGAPALDLLAALPVPDASPSARPIDIA